MMCSVRPRPIGRSALNEHASKNTKASSFISVTAISVDCLLCGRITGFNDLKPIFTALQLESKAIGPLLFVNERPSTVVRALELASRMQPLVFALEQPRRNR